MGRLAKGELHIFHHAPPKNFMFARDFLFWSYFDHILVIFWSYSIWVKVPSSRNTVVAGVADSVDVDAVQARAQPEHPPVDPHMARPL